MSDESASSASSRSKGRSPSYPGVSLEAAIARARQLYAKERLYPTPLMTVMKHWGYTSSTGRSGLAVAALKKFGLLEEVGKGKAEDRRLQLTQLADDILNNPSSEAKREAIQAAALNPSIHRDMWEEYGRQLPSDANVEFGLRRNRGFTESGAAEFVREYRETMEFAGFLGNGTQETSQVEDIFQDEAEPSVDVTAAPAVVRPAEIPSDPAIQNVSGIAQPKAVQIDVPGQPVQSYPIPIALHGRPPVVVTGAFPLSEDEWSQFCAVLTAMKPVLVATLPAAKVQPEE